MASFGHSPGLGGDCMMGGGQRFQNKVAVAERVDVAHPMALRCSALFLVSTARESALVLLRVWMSNQLIRLSSRNSRTNTNFGLVIPL